MLERNTWHILTCETFVVWSHRYFIWGAGQSLVIYDIISLQIAVRTTIAQPQSVVHLLINFQEWDSVCARNDGILFTFPSSNSLKTKGCFRKWGLGVQPESKLACAYLRCKPKQRHHDLCLTLTKRGTIFTPSLYQYGRTSTATKQSSYRNISSSKANKTLFKFVIPSLYWVQCLANGSCSINIEFELIYVSL